MKLSWNFISISEFKNIGRMSHHTTKRSWDGTGWKSMFKKQ